MGEARSGSAYILLEDRAELGIELRTLELVLNVVVVSEAVEEVDVGDQGLRHTKGLIGLDSGLQPDLILVLLLFLHVRDLVQLSELVVDVREDEGVHDHPEELGSG